MGRSGGLGRRIGDLVRVTWRQGLPSGGGMLQPALVGGPRPADPDLPELACVFCGTRRHVIPHRGKGICVDCVREIREMVSGG